MMGKNHRRFGLAVAMVCAAGVSGGQDTAPRLRNNPFRYPEPPSREHTAAVAPKPEPPRLELRATLVSQRQPLAVVGEEVLGIGDETQGYRLVSVEEGEAVFFGHGGRLRLVVGGEETSGHGD